MAEAFLLRQILLLRLQEPRETISYAACNLGRGREDEAVQYQTLISELGRMGCVDRVLVTNETD